MTRTSVALLVVLLFNLQVLSVAGQSLSSESAAWQHWQFHLEHGEHSHDTQLADHAVSENLLHVDISQTGAAGLVVAPVTTESFKASSQLVVLPPPSHTSPHLGTDTPPPIA
ncbi:hypothetical protein H9C73_07530 [Marinobacterium sp. AK62]|uniref:Cobalt transporter n=1 Tax=Marinobacterium alkalitolerans TaxID=1542925 RepID=A0ABS3ZC27_9GAMM|nr:hypothetical protein [Marinobacterium alkalitolerans]MBP0048584.1 hypothetical protein [Marinobacterium alkalitolerans]